MAEEMKNKRRELTRSEMRKRLFKAAIDLFREKGYSEVSVRQICEAAGVARSSFYSAYSSKEDLVISIYSAEVLRSPTMVDQFIGTSNDYERIRFIYSWYVNLAMKVGPVVSASLMIIELNKNVGIYDKMMEARKWSVPLCRNCQKLKIIRNQTDAETLITLVSAALNNLVFEWCRCGGDYPLKELSIEAMDSLFDVSEEYRWKK